MRTAHLYVAAAAMAGSALLSAPASADRVCDRNCVGPLCSEQCVQQDRDLTVGRGARDTDVTIEERRHIREPGVEIRRDPGVEIRERRPGVDIEIGR
jgi:hypothetical protein